MSYDLFEHHIISIISYHLISYHILSSYHTISYSLIGIWTVAWNHFTPTEIMEEGEGVSSDFSRPVWNRHGMQNPFCELSCFHWPAGLHSCDANSLIFHYCLGERGRTPALGRDWHGISWCVSEGVCIAFVTKTWVLRSCSLRKIWKMRSRKWYDSSEKSLNEANCKKETWCQTWNGV